MQIHFTDHETPPSFIVYQEMKINNPKLEKTTQVITELFAQFDDGNLAVTIEAWSKYRKSFDKIFVIN